MDLVGYKSSLGQVFDGDFGRSNKKGKWMFIIFENIRIFKVQTDFKYAGVKLSMML